MKKREKIIRGILGITLTTCLCACTKEKVETGGENMYSENNKEQWEMGICSDVVDMPDKGMIKIYVNNYGDKSTNYHVYDITKDDYNDAVQKYKSEGFTVVQTEEEDEFDAKNVDGSVRINLKYEEDDSKYDIYIDCLNSSMPVEENEWEKGLCAQYAPKPSRDFRLLYNRYENYEVSSVYEMDECSEEETEAYIKKCEEFGLTKNTSRERQENASEIWWRSESSDELTKIYVTRTYSINYSQIEIHHKN